MHTHSFPRSSGVQFGRLLLSLVALTVGALPARADSLWISVLWPESATAIPNTYPRGISLTLSNNALPAPTGSLQWLHDEQPIPGANGLSVTIPNLSPADAGNYRLRSTTGNTATYSNTITVNVLPPLPTTVDTSFSSNLPASYHVADATAFASDGSFIVQSTSLNAPPPARIANDGSVVAGFTFPASAGSVLAGFPDGRLLTSGPPYLLAADGSALPFTLPSTFDATKPLDAAVVAADGKFLLSQGTKIVRFLSNGTVDPTFSFSTTDDAAAAYAIDTQGRIYVQVRRLATNPNNFPSSWTVIYRVNADGTRDSAFPEQTSIMTYYTWLKVVPLADGRIFYWSAYHGYYSWKVYHSDGSLDSNWSGGVYTDREIIVDPVHSYVYFRSASGMLRRYLIGPTSLIEDTEFFVGMTAGSAWPQFTVAPDGQLLLFTTTATWDGHATSNLARVRTDVPRPVLPPTADITSPTSTPARGDTVTLAARVSELPATYQWLALDGQPLPADTTSSQIVIPNFSSANLGRYQLRVQTASGTVLSGVADLELDPGRQPYIANLSGRVLAGTGEDAPIAGVTTKVYAGALGVPLLIRGVGPALHDLGVSNFLPNPTVNLVDRFGTVFGNNDNWSDNPNHETIRTDAAATGAFALKGNSLDAALLTSSSNDQFTVHLSDQAGATGVGLVEVYRVPDDRVVGELTNLSLRAHTGAGEGVAIAGFVIVDPQNFGRPVRVLLRVIGPTLSRYGVQHPVADPILTLYNSKGEVVRRVDNWGDDSNLATLTGTMKDVGAFDLPTGSKDAAVVLDLPAGVYTMHAEGGEGVALLEIYLVR